MSTEDGAIRSADSLIRPAVMETLQSLATVQEDSALMRLAELYARQLDKAGAIAAKADQVLSRIKGDDDPDLHELVSALKAKLSERAAVESIGPKLLAALEALGATPKARAAVKKGGGSNGTGKLAALRAARTA